MSHELHFDPEMPSALSALADERAQRKKEFDPYLFEVELYLEQGALDPSDREWLNLDYARVSFTRTVYELSYAYRLLELTQDAASQQDIEQLDELLGEAVDAVMRSRAGARQAGVDVNEILDQQGLVQYRIID